MFAAGTAAGDATVINDNNYKLVLIIHNRNHISPSIFSILNNTE